MAAVDVSDEPPPPAPKERSGLLEFLMCGDEEVAVWDRIRPDAPSAASPARRIEELENTVKELSRLVKPHLRHKHSKKHPKKKEKEVEFEAVDDDEECKDSSSSYSEPHGTGGIVDILTHKHHETVPERPGVDRASSLGDDDEGTTPGGSRRHSKRTSTVLREGFEAVTGVHIDAPILKKQESLVGREREEYLTMIQGELADRAFGSSYCYTQFKLVHLTLSFSSLTSAAWTYTGLWLQAYVLCTVIDAKYMNWDNRNVTPLNYESASNYYTKNPMRDGSEYSENWYELTRKGHVWDIPFIIIGPLMFASLMIALSLRQEIHELVVGALLVMPKWEEFQLCETRLQRAGWLIGRGLAYGIHIMRGAASRRLCSTDGTHTVAFVGGCLLSSYTSRRRCACSARRTGPSRSFWTASRSCSSSSWTT